MRKSNLKVAYYELFISKGGQKMIKNYITCNELVATLVEMKGRGFRKSKTLKSINSDQCRRSSFQKACVIITSHHSQVY